MIDAPMYLDEECSHKGCGQQAVEQDYYETDLCPDHVKYEMEWDRADEYWERKGDDGTEYP